ncbi:MAG: signal peptidase II [Proteobacteria bacterium]|nr:signal peptidase II [Pseudomonadota bacterium]MCZ6783963.1 signal peptidase II [Pseudomonadota bacterium]
MALFMTPKMKFFLAALLITLPLDQLTKQMIIAEFHYGEVLQVIPGLFDLTHVRNPGGAFSFFASGSLEQRLIFFIGTTVIAIGLLLVFFRKLEPGARMAATSLGMILGGALGNLIDRILYSEVIDFLDVHLWGGYTWPTFNLADSFIVVGVAVLIIETFLDREEPSPEPASAQPQS